MRSILLIVFLALPVLNVFAQNSQKMNWWDEAKFGMFVHWGVYAVPAGTYNGQKIKGIGEWIMSKGKIPVKEYKAYGAQFNPVKYDPQAWVKLAKEAGMKYLVVTSKHHDGFALFDSKVTDWDVVDATPYGRDVLAPLVEACREEGLKIGFYYSQAQDWSHPGGAVRDGRWDKDQKGGMDQYLDEIAVPQVKEILENYGGLDILWWDTPIDMTKERAEKFLPIIGKYPDLITNNRLGGGYKGDTETPEQFVPATGFPGRHWEVCMTMNGTWGYKSYDQHWKSTEVLLRTLVDIVSKGGNFLLNVGPTAEGLIPDQSIERLQEIGEWMKVNGQAIYGTQPSPFHYLSWGRCTRKENKLFLHVFDWPDNGVLPVHLLNHIKEAYLLSNSKGLKVKGKGRDKRIILPDSAPDKHVSVIVLEIEGSPKVSAIPTKGKKVIASSEKPGHKAANLTDSNPKNSWQPLESDKERWAEVDLGSPVRIGAVSVAEPWRPWAGKGQKFALQYLDKGTWKTALEFKTNGTGHTENIKPVTARRFKLKILESGEPLLNEWILYRPG